MGIPGLALGAGAAQSLIPAAAVAADGLVLRLAGETDLACLAAGLLVAGAAAQAFGVWRRRRWLCFAGMAAVAGSALLDRDLVLIVGQALVAGIAWPRLNGKAPH